MSDDFKLDRLKQFLDRHGAAGRAQEVLAGALASVLLCVYAVSYAAAVFGGPAREALPAALWGFLFASALATFVVGLRTSLVPLAVGADSIAVAMLIPIVAHVAAKVAAAGGDLNAVAQTVLAISVLCTLAFGVLVYAVGALRFGAHVRFIPFSLVEGFWMATGIVIVLGGLRVVAGQPLSAEVLVRGDGGSLHLRLAVTAASVLAFWFVQWRFRTTPYATPAFFLALSLVLDLIVWTFAAGGAGRSWYVLGADNIEPWSTPGLLAAPNVSWAVLAGEVANVVAFAAVTLVSVVVKTASIEAERGRIADIDRELEGHGLANIAVGCAGGFAQATIVATTSVLSRSGGRTVTASNAAAVILLVVALSGIDILSVIPTPVIGGFLVLLGGQLFAGALGRCWRLGGTIDRVLSLTIAAACIVQGFFVGIAVGVIAACILFAITYRNLGIIRRHATRARLTSQFDRSPEDMDLLREQGHAIQVFWLAGYVFFGSAHAVLQAVHQATLSTVVPVRFVVLDLARVDGLDTAAVMDVAKLARLCTGQGVVLVFAGMSPGVARVLAAAGIFEPGTGHRSVAKRDDGLVWCEEQLLAGFRKQRQSEALSFEAWLSATIGTDGLVGFLQKRTLPRGTRVYGENDPADTVDLVASGTLAITREDSEGRRVTLRRIADRTVIGEMGLFRRLPRAANVDAETDVVLYTLRREDYERMSREQPAVALAFDAFIIRTLSNRVEAANREISALV